MGEAWVFGGPAIANEENITATMNIPKTLPVFPFDNIFLPPLVGLLNAQCLQK
jgi:hypothetical protein